MMPPTARPASALAALVLLLVVFVVGVAVGQSGAFGGPGGGSVTPTAASDRATPSPQGSGEPGLTGFDLFWEALGIIRGNYVGRAQLDDKTLVYGAVRGLVDALGDTAHSVFMTPEEVQSEQNALNGSVVGIGVLLGERLELSIVREQLRVPAASWTMVPGTKIGLLRLVQFSAGSADELRIVRDAAVAAGATGLILDLRGNPGGYVDQAVNAASLFLTDKSVYIRELAD